MHVVQGVGVEAMSSHGHLLPFFFFLFFLKKPAQPARSPLSRVAPTHPYSPRYIMFMRIHVVDGRSAEPCPRHLVFCLLCHQAGIAYIAKWGVGPTDPTSTLHEHVTKHHVDDTQVNWLPSSCSACRRLTRYVPFACDGLGYLRWT